MGDVLRGVLFSLGGNIAISVGDHLKVFGDIDRRRRGKKLHHAKTLSHNRVHRHRQLFFGLLGYIVMITGQLCNGYALAFAPQTLLACIGSIQFIMNLVCSAILMGRSIQFIHIIGTLSIISGCLLMIFGFSPKTDTSKLTVYTLFYNFNSVHYRNYLMAVVIVFTASIIWQWFEAKYLLPHPHSAHSHHHSHHSKSPSKRNMKLTTPNGSLSSKWSVCFRWKLVSGFFYSFSSAMTGTQSVVLGKTLAIIIRNYAAGKIVIFNPLDLFILFFIIIVFLSFLVTFAFWLYRRTESMVLFDTVLIAPLNQVMWLTFSTVAGGIYFHEFENATTMQWVALITGMILNYLGLYHLVPTKADHPILIINMEKPQKQKCDDSLNNSYIELNNGTNTSGNGNNNKAMSVPKGDLDSTHKNKEWKRQQHLKQSDDFENLSDSYSKSYSRRQRYLAMKQQQKQKQIGNNNKSGNKSNTNNTRDAWIPMEILPPEESDVTDDEMDDSITLKVDLMTTRRSSNGSNGHDGDTESDDDEGRPLLMNHGTSSKSNRIIGSRSNGYHHSKRK